MGIKYKLEFISHAHFGSGTARGLADNGVVRDALGNPYVPGSTIKGRLRYYCEKILNERGENYCTPFTNNPCKRCKICSIFGFAGGIGGKAVFSDALLIDDLREYGKFCFFTRDGIMISRGRGVTVEGHLFKTEMLLPGLVFTGEIEGNLTEDEKQLIREGLQAITHIGGNKSRGLGRCKFTIEEVNQ